MATTINLIRRNILLLAGMGVLACAVHAQTATSTPSREPHAWQAALPRLTAEAYFTNLKDGDKIETPYLVKFGLSGGWGLAPIAKAARAKSGHHHLLVNRPLPPPIYCPLTALGFDTARLLATCLERLAQQRAGQTPETLTLFEPEFFEVELSPLPA